MEQVFRTRESFLKILYTIFLIFDVRCAKTTPILEALDLIFAIFHAKKETRKGESRHVARKLGVYLKVHPGEAQSCYLAKAK